MAEAAAASNRHSGDADRHREVAIAPAGRAGGDNRRSVCYACASPFQVDRSRAPAARAQPAILCASAGPEHQPPGQSFPVMHRGHRARRGGGGELGAVADAELQVDAREVHLDGGAGDEQARWRSAGSTARSTASVADLELGGGEAVPAGSTADRAGRGRVGRRQSHRRARAPRLPPTPRSTMSSPSRSIDRARASSIQSSVEPSAAQRKARRAPCSLPPSRRAARAVSPRARRQTAPAPPAHPRLRAPRRARRRSRGSAWSSSRPRSTAPSRMAAHPADPVGEGTVARTAGCARRRVRSSRACASAPRAGRDGPGRSARASRA